MADHVVVHWLYTTISPELLDAVMQPDDTGLTVWAAVDGIFRDNQLARAVYLDAEYHAVVQGDMTVMAYCTKLKQFTDQLRDLGQPMTEPQQVFNLLRGLNQQYHSAIPHITSQVPLPSFLQVRSFLLLEEHRAEQSTRQQSVHALVAGRGSSSTPPAPPPSNTNQGRGRQRRRGRGNGGGGAPPTSPSTPRPPTYPAPALGANSWTGLV
uniref:Retrotransposon gag domain-containing protein n=1 Tax=Aegilops tauschii subsp. strangulata TaxID=200361 RepID=A0A453AXK4_AEGTS